MPIINSKIGVDVTIHHPGLVNIYGCEISKGCKIGTFVEIQKNVFIGQNTKISSHSFICEGVQIEENVFRLLKEEEKFGIKKFETYKKFGEKIYQIRENVIKNLKELKNTNKNLVGYGAPAKATTALNFFGISDEIDYIIEDNKLKQGKYLPGVKIPIVNNNKKIAPNSCLLVLAWNFYNEIKKKNEYKFKKIFNIKSLEKRNSFDE